MTATCPLCHPFRQRVCFILCREMCVGPVAKRGWLHRLIFADAEESLRYGAIDRELEREGEG